MNHRWTLGFGLALGLSAAACGGDSGSSGGNNPPPAPALGEQIDRMGRPGVNTAVTDPFNTMSTMQDASKDSYNGTAQSMWVSKYAAPATSLTSQSQFAKILAIYDAADGHCGNQFAAGMTVNAQRYDGLAKVLADDQLYVNTDSGTCNTYLGVEANATMIIPNGDCGGRKPQYDVIKLTYNVLITGMNNTAITDGVMPKTNYTDTFPFLAKP